MDNSSVRETAFLEQYRISDFERPSVAADVVAFSLHTGQEECYRKNPELNLCLLLVKRGEHPFQDCWALPGGFVRSNETIEECACREIQEETNVLPVTLLPVGTFSDPKRDPRGWIISISFACIVNEEHITLHSGSDASDAKWFDVSFAEEADECTLKLTCEELCLVSRLRKTQNKLTGTQYEVLEQSDLAFDHAKIIAAALRTLRQEADDFHLAFDFLPQRFTLSALQKVQEALIGAPLLTANFRRKLADHVIETDESTEGAGHRPAKLYERRYHDE